MKIIKKVRRNDFDPTDLSFICIIYSFAHLIASAIIASPTTRRSKTPVIRNGKNVPYNAGIDAIAANGALFNPHTTKIVMIGHINVSITRRSVENIIILNKIEPGFANFAPNISPQWAHGIMVQMINPTTVPKII